MCYWTRGLVSKFALQILRSESPMATIILQLGTYDGFLITDIIQKLYSMCMKEDTFYYGRSAIESVSETPR